MDDENKLQAEVISVYPDKIEVLIDKIEDYKYADNSLKVGSYLQIYDNENSIIIAVIENFSIIVNEKGDKLYKLQSRPLGILKGDNFIRGGDSIAIPPKTAEIATEESIKKIYMSNIEEKNKFVFSRLANLNNILVPVDGNKFFNKHIAIVGSTGSGKSNTIAKIIQKAVEEKNGDYNLNNSHVIIFDIHSEYKKAFPNATYIDINSLNLPYWLLNSEELEELFIDTEANDYNQRNILKEAIVKNKKFYSVEEKDKIHYDMPVFFDINEVVTYIENRNNEKNNKELNKVEWIDDGTKIHLEEKGEDILFKKNVQACNGTTTNTQNGRFINFLNRLENKINDKRYNFLLGEKSKSISFEETLKNLLGYKEENESNVIIFDLSGIPFEVLSITVSLISRIIFEYGYYYKRLKEIENSSDTASNDVPVLLVYEEAHRYVPKSDLSKFRASRNSIERIAKEGRKYGVTLLLSSQRPSEISETIFSQCNNFIAMRLTNPNDQNYVKKLLPDVMGGMIDKIQSLQAGEALIIGDSIVVPSLVKIEECINKPSSVDIPYFDLWKEKWKDIDFKKLEKEWHK